MADPKMSSLDEYLKSLNESKRRGIFLTGLGALQNTGVIQKAMNAPQSEGLPPIVYKAPYISSPGSEIMQNAYRGKTSEIVNSSNRLLMEMGRPELAVGINDIASKNFYEASMQALGAEYETMAKNQLGFVEAENKTLEAAANTKKYNIEKQARENEFDSKTISEALNSLYAMGGNLSNILGTSDYYKLVAGKMYGDEVSRNSQSFSDIKIDEKLPE